MCLCSKSNRAVWNSRAEFRRQSHTGAISSLWYRLPLGLLRSWPASFWNECLGPTIRFQYQLASVLRKPFFQGFDSCQVSSFFCCCFKSNKAVSSSACSSLAILFVLAMVGRAVFHFRSLQSCSWNLFNHAAAKATVNQREVLKGEKSPADFSICLRLTKLLFGLCPGAPHWELYGVTLGSFGPFIVPEVQTQQIAPLCCSFKYESVYMWVTITTSMTNLVSTLPEIS